MRQVDLDLFVNSASKGFNDGSKVATPFAAFLEGLSKGIDQSYENELKSQQAEGQRIQNEQEPYRDAILEAQAIEAKVKGEAISENKEAYKDTIISKAQTDRLAADQAQAYATKKTKLTEIFNSGDGKAIGEAFLDRNNKEVFTKDKALEEQYKSAYPDWGEDTKASYIAQERAAREVKTNEALHSDAVSIFEKNKPDYVANHDINVLKEKIKEKTGTLPSDTDLLEKGTITSVPAAKPVPEFTTIKDPETGIPKKVPTGKMIPNPYASDPSDFEDKIVLQYGGEKYDVGTGIPADTSRLFNTMQSANRRMNYMDKGQFGTTDLEFMDAQKKKTNNEAIAKAQADAAQTNEQLQAQQAEFFKGSNVARDTIIERDLMPSPRGKVSFDKDLKVSSDIAPTAVDKKIVGNPLEKPSLPQVIPTGTVMSQLLEGAPPSPPRTDTLIAKLLGETSPTSQPLSPIQKIQAIKKQAQAVKADQFTSKYQPSVLEKAGSALNKLNPLAVEDAQAEEPAVQATRIAASPYIPKNISTNLPYQPNTEAINTVASRPEMAGLSALTKAVAVQESGGVNAAKSPTGVTGIMQVTGATGRSINPDFDRTNPVHQALAGAITLSRLTDKYPNSPMLALTAYNAGTVLTDEAVKRAGTTNWSVVKNYMEEAGNSERVQNAWYRDFINAKISPARAKKLVKTKVQEASTYAEKVIVNFPAFAFNNDDNRVLQLLKQQGVFQS